MKKGLAVGIIALLLVASISSLSLGDKTEYRLDTTMSEESNSIIEPTSPTSPKNPGPAWPMFGYNQYNTGLSPYSTENVTGIEKWRFDIGQVLHASPVIDSNNNIYIGVRNFYAIHPDGTLKWMYDTTSTIYNTPAIDENLGVIYVAPTTDAKLYSIYLSNGTLKWRSDVPAGYTYASPIIGPDGMIYVSGGEFIHAVFPENGTGKWHFQTGDNIYSVPALSDEGILYFGSHDNNVYALWAENGSLIWTYDTGNWVHGAPAIGADGMVYIGSDSGYLYVFYPNNGTVKWQEWYGGMWAAPAIDDNGFLYFGVYEGDFYCIYPDGTIKWEYNLGGNIWGSSAAISADGTVYFGYCVDWWHNEDGEIYALDQDGNLKWKKIISTKGCDSSPAIDSDGNVYIGSAGDDFSAGCLHAFGSVISNEPPNIPSILGPSEGEVGDYIVYEFNSDDPDNNPVAYYVDWGDGTNSGWTIDFKSGADIRLGHEWENQGNYTIAFKARDSVGAESDWGYLEVTMPVNKPIQYYGFPLIQKILELFPDAFPILRQVLRGL